AGELGRGFAVVAGEVKELANQSSRATEDISRRIEAIQQSVASSTTGIEQIRETISEILSTTTDIARTVRQEASSSREVCHEIVGAAEGGERISSVARRLIETTSAAATGAEHTRATALHLANLSGSLEKHVGQYG
ncbi:MAG: hypothetical protein KDC38_04335, partial [Planctomycetes bacterium]|nr:hypothetical protein [Planctomycetota bacterium]